VKIPRAAAINLLGNSAPVVGIHFPRLGERFDLTLEASEWQNAWYVHSWVRDRHVQRRAVISNCSATSACWVTAWAGGQRDRAPLTGQMCLG